MLKINALTYQGQPVANPITARFGRAGGRIGRDAECILSLPDPQRHLSRRHAEIVFEDGCYRIRNITANNFIIANGNTLHPGQSSKLEAGHQLYIGHYLLQVAAIESNSAEFAAYSTDPPQRGSPPLERRPPGNSAPGMTDAMNVPVTRETPDDPFGVLRPNADLPASFDPLIRPAQLNIAHIESAKRASPAADPFMLPSLVSRNAADPLLDRAQEVSLRDIRGQAAEIDELYPVCAGQLREADPLHAPPRGADIALLQTQPTLDPLVLFGEDPTSVQALLPPDQPSTVDDHADQLVMHLDLPQPLTTSAPPDSDGALQSSGASGFNGEPPSEAPQQAAHSVALDAAAGASRIAGDAHDCLLAAFLDGARLPQGMLAPPLTPEFLRTVGAMLFTAMQGTVDLMSARAATKREVKAEMTLILPAQNNPLKFVPDGRAALIHMFGKQIPGFSGPIDAMQDAYRDLRTHQVGIFAGMRAALGEVLQRFSPAEMEQRLAQMPMIDSIMPAQRKARLWDLYGQQFKKTCAEAEEDFDVIFGDAFALAYEAQIRSSRATPNPEP